MKESYFNRISSLFEKFYNLNLNALQFPLKVQKQVERRLSGRIQSSKVYLQNRMILRKLHQ